jgi:tetrahydromethanopterin S-methyltransferase subunit G
MAVMMPREKWTDERLDDLNKKVDDGFADTKAEMRAGFARVDGEIKELRREVNARFEKVDARFDALNDRFDALNRNMVGGLFVVVAAIIGSAAL